MDMAKNGRPSAEHTPVRAPNSPSSPQVLAAGSSPPPPPPRTKMGSSSGDFFLASSANARTTATKPLTMFYNGGVAVFHLPQDKAEDLVKVAAAEGGGDDRPGPLRPNHGEELSKMRQEMPIASKRSLQRFFQKRKERMFRP